MADPSALATTIFLVRHGQTHSNITGRFTGRLPEPLTAEGREQARKAGEALAAHNISVVVTSPVARARETAEIISAATGAPVSEHRAFSEIAIPQWEGRLKEELLADQASGYRSWKEAPHRFAMPGAESLADLQKRAVAGIMELFRSRSGQRIVLVSHLSVLRCMVLHFTGRGLEAYREVKIPNATPLALSMRGDHISFQSETA